MEPVGPDEYEATMTVKVASIGGSFKGHVALIDMQEPASYVMRVDGGGKPGRVHGQGTLHLEEQDGQTHVSYEGDVNIAGAIAAVGQRLLGVTAKMMIGKFFDCMEERIAQPSSSTGD